MRPLQNATISSPVQAAPAQIMSTVGATHGLDLITRAFLKPGLALEVAARGILLAGLVNSLVKGVLALVIGGRSLGRRVLLPYLVSILLILPLVLMT